MQWLQKKDDRAPKRARSSRAGFTFVELAIGVVILTLGLLPIFSMMAAGTRQAAFTEYHLFAATRAERILESFLTCSSRYFDGRAELRFELAIGEVADDAGAFPDEYRGKLARGAYSESATAERLEDGLYRLTVTIRWAFPAEQGATAAGREHVFTMSRLLARPDVSFTESSPLDAAPTA